MPSISKPLFVMARRVTMGDVDAARIIYFVAPMGWQEAAFSGWLQEIGHPLSEMIERGQSCPTLSVKADYLVPLELDDWVRVELWPNHVGRRSFSLRTDIHRISDERLCVRMTTWHAWADMAAGRNGRVTALEVPGWLREVLGGAEPAAGALDQEEA